MKRSPIFGLPLILILLFPSINCANNVSPTSPSTEQNVIDKKFETKATQLSLVATIVGSAFTLPAYLFSWGLSGEEIKYDFITYSALSINISVLPGLGYFSAKLYRYALAGILLRLLITAVPFSLGLTAYYKGDHSCREHDNTCWTNEHSAKYAIFYLALLAIPGAAGLAVHDIEMLKYRIRKSRNQELGSIFIAPIHHKNKNGHIGMGIWYHHPF